MIAAYEPSNIIWEDVGVDHSQMTKNKIKTFCIIAFLLIVILVIVAYLNILSTKTKLRYPTSTNCESIMAEFTDAASKVDETRFKYFALKDRKQTLQGKGYGQFQCFCTKYSTMSDARNKDSDCY